MATERECDIHNGEGGKPSPPPQARMWEVILYPDDINTPEALAQLRQVPNVAYILHDKDKHDDGQPKKPHYHCLKIFNNPTTQGSFERLIPNINSNQFRKVASQDGALLYLTHANNPEKAQYPRESIWTNMLDRVNKTYDNVKDVAKDLCAILDFIEEQYCLEWSTLADVMRYCATHGLYAALRQNSSLINQVIKDKMRYEAERARDLRHVEDCSHAQNEAVWTALKLLDYKGILPMATERGRAVRSALFADDGKLVWLSPCKRREA